MELVTPELGLLFWQTLTFLVVLFVLSKFAWKPILSGIKERERTITEALETAKEAEKNMLALKADNEKLLAEARAEKERLLREAQAISANMISEAKEKASLEAKKMLDNALAEINTSKSAAMAEIKNHVASLSLQIAEKLVRKNLATDADQVKLVNEFLEQNSKNYQSN